MFSSTHPTQRFAQPQTSQAVAAAAPLPLAQVLGPDLMELLTAEEIAALMAVASLQEKAPTPNPKKPIQAPKEYYPAPMDFSWKLPEDLFDDGDLFSNPNTTTAFRPPQPQATPTITTTNAGFRPSSNNNIHHPHPHQLCNGNGAVIMGGGGGGNGMFRTPTGGVQMNAIGNKANAALAAMTRPTTQVRLDRSVSIDTSAESIDGSISPLPSPGSSATTVHSSILGFTPSELQSLRAATTNTTGPMVMLAANPTVNPLDGSLTVANLVIPVSIPKSQQTSSFRPQGTSPSLMPNLNPGAVTPPQALASANNAAKACGNPANNRSGPPVIMDLMFRIMQSNPEAQRDCTLGWVVLKTIWNLTPSDFDASVLDVLLNQKTARQAEEILFAIAAVDMRNVRHLSPFAKSIIKEHETLSQVCMRFLAGLCNNECADHQAHCPFVHPENTIGWEVLKQRWNVTYRDMDFAAISYLCKQPAEDRDPILLAFAEQDLKSVRNVSCQFSRTIRAYEAARRRKVGL